MDRLPIRRYELTGAPATELGRYWSAIQLVVSVVLALVVWSVVWSPIFVVIALGSVFGLLRRAKPGFFVELHDDGIVVNMADRKSTRLNSSHGYISYAVFCL